MTILNNHSNHQSTASRLTISKTHRGDDDESSLDRTRRRRPARSGQLRRQECFFLNYEEERDSLTYSSTAFELEENSSRISWFSCGSSSIDSFAAESSEEILVATRRRPKAVHDNNEHHHVRFSEEPPEVHYYEKPTEDEKHLMYCNSIDYQDIMADFYIEALTIATKNVVESQGYEQEIGGYF